MGTLFDINVNLGVYDGRRDGDRKHEDSPLQFKDINICNSPLACLNLLGYIPAHLHGVLKEINS
jgi:hypothetical protein